MKYSLLVTLTLVGTFSNASNLNMFGNGAHNMALGNSAVSLPIDAFSQNYNPALMSWQDHPLFSLGLQGAITNFQSINQVLVDSPSLGGTNRVANVSTNTPDTFLVTLAYQTPLSKSSDKPLHFGIYLLTPVQKILGLNSEDNFQPQYALYLNDTQRFITGINLSLKITQSLSLGLGLELYFAQGITGILRQPAQGNSTSRLQADIVPFLAPAAGLEMVLDEASHFRLGVSYTGKEDYSSTLNIQDSISVVGSTPINFVGQSSLFYDPETYRLGLSFSDENWSDLISADWQRWNGYNGSMMVLTYSSLIGTFGQTLPPTPFHDVIVLHGGVERRFQSNSLSLGYSFIPTPVPDQSGDSNVLDNDRHVLALGYGRAFRSSLIDGSLKIDLAGFYQLIVPKQVVKNSSQSIGYPGYQIGGNVWGYGLTLTAEL